MSINSWVPVTWCLDNAGEHGAFFDGELFNIFVEVRQRSGLQTVSVAAEVHGVEISVEDVFLRPLVGHLDGIHQLTCFTHIGDLIADQRVFHVLLGNCRATTGGVIASNLADDRAHQAGKRET